MNNCIFCKIATEQLPGHIIYEDDNILAMLDIFPSSLGHTLIIPKAHYENIFEIPEDTAANLQRVVVRTAKALQASLGTSSINILQNNGKGAGQTVFHYHVHIIPRYKGDGIRFHWPVAKPTAEEFAACAENIKLKMPN
ncbi:MAG: HIT family protein [Defluviitaleaceae bacterium]|nr:HIT family protein [Defluviitaleaceae bacterium]